MARRSRAQPTGAADGPIQPPGAESDSADRHAYTYQQKYTRCNKPACRRCAEGAGHGPYWYAFWWEGGRTRSRYLGKELPATVRTPEPSSDAPAPARTDAPMVRVITLGRFAVWRDEVLLPETAWPRRKATALFKLLLGAPGRRLLRDQVLDLLWPDEDPREAGASLRGATHGLRRALDLPDADAALQVHGGVLALAGSPALWVDADAFAAAAAEALAGREIESCRAALALYGGEYLPDERYEDWALHRREELAELRVSVLLHQARLCAEHGDLAEARAALAAVLAGDPAHEEAACRQMTLLSAMGERTEALRVYERLRAALHEEYALEPGREVAGLARSLRAQHDARATPQAHLPAPPRHTNLPAAQSTFVGRQDAQDAIQHALGATRLVTLTGAGGSGKTRLAVRVAESLLDAYPDGVWLCELAGLAPVAEGTSEGAGMDAVAGAVAGALGLLEDPGCPLLQTICAFLEPRRLLLVLDNCEHVLDPAAGLVAAILARCPSITVLATSRQVFGLADEAVWTVPPLACPDAGQRCTPDEMEGYDAIRLFVERARARQPGFTLSAATAPLVLEICRRLDGIPLAIELAAARLAFLSLEALAARLGDRFHLLVGGSRIALPRQQTLLATMDWSYSLLGVRERTLLHRLTVFVGGWTLAAAEGICADVALPYEMVMETLGGLVAKSLVTIQEAGESLRYGMLETVRQYGLPKLVEAREEAALRERHLAWLAQHCEAAIAGWSSTDQATLLRRLDAELENIRAALSWGLEPGGDGVAALRLASALSRYWTTRGFVSEGRRWTQRALDAAPDAPAALRATALNRCAILARTAGDDAGAGVLWEASLALFRTLGDETGIARVVGNLGLMHYDLGDDMAAVEALTESLKLLQHQGNIQAIADMWLNLGMVYTRQRQYAAAEAALAEAGAIWQATGNQVSIANTYVHAAHLARDQQQYDRAARLYAASLRISLDLDARPLLPPALEGTAHVLLHRCTTGQCEQLELEFSTQLFACAAALRESTGVPLPTESQRVYLPDLQQLQALLGPAAFEAAWSMGWGMPVLSLVERIPAEPGEGGEAPSIGKGNGAVSIAPLPLPGLSGKQNPRRWGG